MRRTRRNTACLRAAAQSTRFPNDGGGRHGRIRYACASVLASDALVCRARRTPVSRQTAWRVVRLRPIERFAHPRHGCPRLRMPVAFPTNRWGPVVASAVRLREADGRPSGGGSGKSCCLYRACCNYRRYCQVNSIAFDPSKSINTETVDRCARSPVRQRWLLLADVTESDREGSAGSLPGKRGSSTAI